MMRLEELENLDRPHLLDAWQETFGSDAPKGISQSFLRHFLAFEIQLRTKGRLPKEVAQLCKGTHGQSTSMRPIPQDGTRFVREWQGRTHVVEKTSLGFQWNGQTYKSLSAIARAITGARWSGPRFFGLSSGEQK